jgi:hypothetical protein
MLLHVYPIIHVKGEDLKEPYDYHTQLLAPNLLSSESKQVVDKNLVDDVLKYMVQFKGVCTCDMECYKGTPQAANDPGKAWSGKYGACAQTCPNDTCNCIGQCECPCQCQCECYEVRNGNTLVCPCNCEVASENCHYPCECNCNCACPYPCPCECECQCKAPTCEPPGSGIPKMKEVSPDGKIITYCQTTCYTCIDGKTVTGNCGKFSDDASTCPYGVCAQTCPNDTCNW